MESSVYFKFKSQKEPTRVQFDGTGISVFELKREIILKSGLGSGTDFDLAIYTEDGSEEYYDDTTIIPRSTTVVARRLPAAKPGAGRAARYVSGKMPVHAKNQSRREQVSKAAANKSKSDAIEQMSKAMTEEEKIAAMFKAQSDAWNTNEEELAKNATTNRVTQHKKTANVPDHEPPNGYICYRCGEKGHWIQLCPTNDNPEYDNRPRVKRTTGIPRSFLKTVDKSTALGHGGADEDAKPPAGIMVNADGEFVVAQPDNASWQQFQAKAQTAASKQVEEGGNKDLQERGLECELDKKVFLDPMKTPCCGKTFCNECISNALMETDFVCPGCHKEGVLLDDLKHDAEAAARVRQYLDNQSDDKSPAPQSQVQQSSAVDVLLVGKSSADHALTSQTSSASSAVPVKSPTPSTTNDSEKAPPANPKKRRGDESLQNPRIPKGPKSMQDSPVQSQAEPQQQALTQQQKQPTPQQQKQQPATTSTQQIQQASSSSSSTSSSSQPAQQQPNAQHQMHNSQMSSQMMNSMMNGMMPMGMNMNNMNPYMMQSMGMGMYMNGYPNYQQGMNGAGANGMYQQSMNGGGMGMLGSGMNGNGYGGGYNNQGGYGNQQQQQRQQQQWRGGYNNNRNHGNRGGYNSTGGYPNGSTYMNNDGAQYVGDEEDAYMRKPVNPHRHQNRLRRARPSDYREL